MALVPRGEHWTTSCTHSLYLFQNIFAEFFKMQLSLQQILLGYLLNLPDHSIGSLRVGLRNLQVKQIPKLLLKNTRLENHCYWLRILIITIQSYLTQPQNIGVGFFFFFSFFLTKKYISLNIISARSLKHAVDQITHWLWFGRGKDWCSTL